MSTSIQDYQFDLFGRPMILGFDTENIEGPHWWADDTGGGKCFYEPDKKRWINGGFKSYGSAFHGHDEEAREEARSFNEKQQSLLPLPTHLHGTAIHAADLLASVDAAEERQREQQQAKEELLKKYASGKVRKFLQLDGWYVPDSRDCIMRPDEEGDCIFSGITEEFRRSDEDLAVRVFIHDGTSREVALRLLGKLRDWLAREPGVGFGNVVDDGGCLRIKCEVSKDELDAIPF